MHAIYVSCQAPHARYTGILPGPTRTLYRYTARPHMHAIEVYYQALHARCAYTSPTHETGTCNTISCANTKPTPNIAPSKTYAHTRVCVCILTFRSLVQVQPQDYTSLHKPFHIFIPYSLDYARLRCYTGLHESIQSCAAMMPGRGRCCSSVPATELTSGTICVGIVSAEGV